MNTIKGTLLVIALMTSTSVIAQSTTNSVYIEQIGDASTVTINQTGQGNQVGDKITDKPVNLQGDGQTVDVTQTGNGNKLNGDIKQSDGSSTTVTNTGDNNDVTLDIGNSGDTGGSTTTISTSGSTNEITLIQGADASATNVKQDIIVTGDLNKILSKVETNDANNAITLAGDSNDVSLLQTGASGKNVNLSVTGSQNQFILSQTSTLNVDSITVSSTGSGNMYTISQCNPGGC